MAHCTWKAKVRRYEAEKRTKLLFGEEATTHPLKSIIVSESKVRRYGGSRSSGTSTPVSSTGSDKGGNLLDPLSFALEGSDPLSRLAEEVVDPLSKMAAEMSVSDNRSKKSAFSGSDDTQSDDTFEQWSSRRAGILAKYTTSEKLSITTSFLSGSEKGIPKLQESTVTEKVRNRLEQLDDFEEGSVKEMLNLSQQDYVNRIEELNNALIIAWQQDQRVKALKIAIQCAKLLADVSVIQFYPSKFVLITDILDTFGRLVYDRIWNKALYVPKGGSKPVQLPSNFTPDLVPESAKETCRNWFFKIASIRELIPRFYVEAAILKCYSFLTSGEYNAALVRLAAMTRGIGDPLVSVYSRCYLCRVGVIVAPDIRDHLMPCFDDFLYTYSQIQGDSVQNILAVQKVELPRYLTLYSPALDWLLRCLSYKAKDDVLAEILEKAKKHCNSPLLLNSIMSAFKPEFMSSRAMEFIELIKDCEDTGFPKYLLYRSLGSCLVLADPPEDQRLVLLNDVWKVVMKLKLPAEYIVCAEVWIEYVVKNFSKRETNTILGDIIKHMTPDRAFEDHYPQLQAVMVKILTHNHDFTTLFAMDKFLPFLDMIQKESVKVEVCKSIMDAYVKYQIEPTSDPVITSALMFICKTMYDSVNALTLEDEKRTIGNLINGFIRSISFGRDFEQQLSFYVESRASFSNLDAVLTFLVQSVNRLAVQTNKIVNGSHTRKTAAFVRACAAYSFITIPSLNSIFGRLQLYLGSGQVALLNQCLSQADAFFKAVVSLIHEVPKTIEMDGKARNTEPLMLDFINNLLSTLLIVPDNPDQGVLYLVRGLLNGLQDYHWDPHSHAQTMIYMNVLVLLSALSQEKFICNVLKVDSNDTLYGCDPKYITEITKLCQTIAEQILVYIRSLDTPESYKKQPGLVLELFTRVVDHFDMDDPSVMMLAVNLWKLAQVQSAADTKKMVKLLDHVKRKGADDKVYLDLASKMPLQSRA